ncbi:MAG: acyltransferase [Alteromonadaceae bacterium]|nr:acyltransferase [Alteromonadaceae bacterium]
MLNFLPVPLIIFFSLTFYVLNTLFWLVPIVIFSFLKAIIPFAAWQKVMSYLLDAMASNWVGVNSFIQDLFTHVNYQHKGLEKLTLNDWYLVISNHQSWVDILVLQRVLHGKIPFLKFFLKKELIYVPFLGIAWWALDFPFMKRFSREFLAKNPHLKGKDIETTRKACEKFKHKPVSVMNFLEGTRFTSVKQKKQGSEFQYLLKPKAGGIAFVLDAMRDHLTTIVNVTIEYPQGIPTFIDFVKGKVTQVNVVIETLPIDEKLIGDYFNDAQYKENFQLWVNQLWCEKDQQLTSMQSEHKSKL